MQPTALKTNALSNALGIDTANPEFSWALNADESGGLKQSAYALQVALDGGFEHLVWNSGRVASSSPFGVRYEGLALKSVCRYFWRVEVIASDGQSSGWSKPAWFETAFLASEPLTGTWIGLPPALDDGLAVVYLRRVLELPAAVVKGRAYASALGWYGL